MQRGEAVDVVVTGLAFGGDSLAAAPDGRVVFFAGGAPGDRVRVRVEEVKPRFARGQLLEVLEAGPERVPARCPLSGRCGGCQWQEVALPAQRAAKQAIVERALGRLGAEVLPLVAASADLGSRSRARLTRGPGAALGFHARRSHQVVDVPACPQLEPALDVALGRLRPLLLAALPPGASASLLLAQGGRVHLAIDSPAEDHGRARRRLAAAALQPLAQHPVVAGLLLDGRPPLSAGSGAGAEADRAAATVDVAATGEAPFWASAGGFAQASHAGNRALRATVLGEAQRLLRGHPRPRLLELHAGDGNFTRDLAPLAGELLAVEGDRAACARLPGNVPGAASLRALALPAEEACRRLLAAGERFDLVVLDPPRPGAPELTPLLPALTARVVYVSCDPMTLARDAAALASGGLRPERATPLDLMPHTAHVEVVCTLRGEPRQTTG